MKGRKILISPLNWGFGHAGRMIPLAKELAARGNTVFFATDPSLRPMLEHDLGEMIFIPFPGLKMTYSRFLPQYVAILLRVPAIIAASLAEHHRLAKLVRDLAPDIIISDNRFGFFRKGIRSVYVTHMLRIPFPSPLRWLEPAGMWLHRAVISNFDLCLIPDFPGEDSLAGRLSHPGILPDKFIYAGPLSRFRNMVDTSPAQPGSEPPTCLILSGPEPQRSMLASLVTSALPDRKVIVLAGTPPAPGSVRGENAAVTVSPTAGEMVSVIRASRTVIARSGYTTIMELSSLGKGAVIIPTPGQTEQEYLADYHHGRNGFRAFRQSDIKPGWNPESGNTGPEGQTVCYDPDRLLRKAVDILLDEKPEAG